ncbi:MAG: LysM peptidoglycan-binding domain-containing protein [Candidatus Dadabacteria bacterium]|nr:LysM peptidoglycan-binding domain-containing protein [Candidatus Dadabacteria bacterium]NIQ13030.1 LysM peptidoglycan-binding domain-containing protein [Candidatus Dadabacteria bacterium]
MKKPSYRYSSYYYRVRRGDTLSTIARRHGTSVRNLKRHNSIRGSFIRAGQRLRIVKGSHRSTYVADSSNSSTYYYRVRRGDTLGTIARRHGTSVKNLKRHNGIRGSFIKAGQRLKIVNGSQKSITTASKGKYIVQRGDSLSVIAQRHKVSVRDLKVANNISGTRIKAGQVINIPSRGSASKAKVEHKIKRGDTLIKIAKAYSVSVSDIKKWNSLDSTKLIAGKNLVIFR